MRRSGLETFASFPHQAGEHEAALLRQPPQKACEFPASGERHKATVRIYPVSRISRAPLCSGIQPKNICEFPQRHSAAARLHVPTSGERDDAALHVQFEHRGPVLQELLHLRQPRHPFHLHCQDTRWSEPCALPQALRIQAVDLATR